MGRKTNKQTNKQANKRATEKSKNTVQKTRTAHWAVCESNAALGTLGI